MNALGPKEGLLGEQVFQKIPLTLEVGVSDCTEISAPPVEDLAQSAVTDGQPLVPVAYETTAQTATLPNEEWSLSGVEYWSADFAGLSFSPVAGLPTAPSWWPFLHSAQLTSATILAIDLVDSTGAMERVEHDGGSTISWLPDVFAPFVPLIERAGGKVMELVGDTMIAVFTAADSAATVSRLATLLQYKDFESEKPDRCGLSFRVGVATGNVWVGYAPSGAQRAVGSTVNRACHAASRASRGGSTQHDGG